MKIINIGILAHVDAGKTTLTESLLYASGAISEPGSVEKGTTRTDTMFLERQRGITIQAAVTSFQWHRCKVNIVDTPGHMDFLAEVYRSLAVLDGAILVISAKDGVQAQTRILFHALRKMNIPTVIFINKIDQAGVDLQSVVQSVRDKLSADIIIKQTVSLSPEIVLEENTDIEAWDAVIENNDELLEKYIAGEPISREKLAREEQQRVQDASLFPVYHGSAKNGLGIQPLMDAVTGLFQPIGEQGGAALCGSVFKVEYTDCGQRRVYLRLYSGTLRLRDTVALAGREKLKITEMRIPSKGEIVRTDTAYQGEIVILPSDSVRLNDVLGDQTRLPRKRWREDPLPMLRTAIAPKTAAQRERLLDALTQLADTDPLLRCEVDSITHEIILSFLGRVQLEVVSALLSEKYKIETEDEKANNEVMAVAIIAIMGTIFALLEIALGPLTGLSKTQLGITAGASLHEIAHAVAAGDAFGAVDIATIMKLSRVLMLVFAAIVIAVWWDKNHSEMPADGKRKVSFPWFMLGFIGASIIGTFVPFIGAIAPNLVDFAYIVLGMAMAALGINVNFSAIAKKGQKAFLASFITSVLLMCFAAGVSALFF